MKQGLLQNFKLLKVPGKVYGFWVAAFFCMIFMNACYAQNPSATPKTATVDVTEKGVKPNDNQGDSKSIQQVIDQARHGTVVFFPAGKYIIDAPVEINQGNIILRGEQGAVFIFDNKTDWYAKYGTRVGMFNVCANNITIDRLYLNQGFSASGRVDGQSPLIGGIIMGCKYKKAGAVNPKNITVTNCTVYDYYGDAISSFNVSISNFTVTNDTLISSYVVGNWKTAGTKGEQAINANSGENILFSNNVIRGALDDAIAVHTNVKNLTVTNNNITSTGGRILVSGVTGGNISGNYIEFIEDGGSAFGGIFHFVSKKLSFNNDVTITNNKVFVNKGVKIVCGIRLLGAGYNVKITDNTFETVDKQGSGIQLQDLTWQADKKKYFGDNITMSNNKFINFKTGIVKNISKNVQAPKLIIKDNEYKGADKEMETLDGSVRSFEY